jgi:dTDP-glucose pyrophosphorylase
MKVVGFDQHKNITEIKEEPKKPKWNFAVPGLCV